MRRCNPRLRNPEKAPLGRRHAREGRRGGLRIIYLHTPEAGRIDLITVYAKDEADDLSKEEVKELCELARILREEATKAAKKNRRKERRR